MAIKLINNRYKLDKVVYDSLYSSLYEVLELWDNDKRLYMKLYNSEKQKNVIDYFINNFIDLARIKHENLLLSYEFDIISTIDGKRVNVKQYYSTIEYIDAPTLDEIYEELNFEKRLDILIQVANVLDFLHYKGIIYKYLSPSHIYILGDGSIKLMDLATIYEKIINSSYDDLTRNFIAPEVLLNQEDLIDCNSDKYSFGMLMIYLLTEDFNNPLKSQFDYINDAQLDENEEDFLNGMIKSLTKKNPGLKEYKFRDVVDDINEKFNMNYKYDLIKERGVLNFQTKIVGREKEIEKILHLDDLAFKGDIDNRVILINGNTGTGKTRLLKEISYLLKLRGRDVYNTEINTEDSIDLKPMVNILRQTIKTAPTDVLDKYAMELAKILPELRPMLGMETSSSIDGDRERLRLFDRISNYLIELSMYEPIYIIIDNLENCSIELLYLIDYLINNIGKGKIILIASYNEKLIPEDSIKMDILYKWLNHKMVEGMLISNLDLSEIGEFIQYILGISYRPLKFSAVMLRESQGNPKYIEYMMKNLYATGELFFSKDGYWGIKTKQYSDIYFPSTIDEALKSQIDLIKDDYMNIMKIVSVYYDAVSKSTLQFILDMDIDELDKKLNELISMKLLDVKVSDWGYSYSINNIQLKRLIYYEMPEDERVATHKKIAEHLEKIYPEDYKPIVSEIIYHLISSNQKHRALEYIIKNARKEHLYSSSSILLWEEAYEIDSELKSEYRLEILENLGSIYIAEGENEKALEVYEELFKNAIDYGKLEYAIMANNGISDIYLKRNQIQLSAEKIEESIELSKEINSLELLIESKALYNRILIDIGKFEESKKNMEDLLELSLNNNLYKNLGDIYNILGLIEYYMGDKEKALNRYEESIEAFEKVGDFINSTKPMNNIANIYIQYGETEKAMEYYEKGLKIVENQGNSYLKLVFLNNIGSIYIELYQYDKAQTYIEEAMALAIEIEESNLELLTYINLSLIYLFIGDYEQSYNYYSILKGKSEKKTYSFEIISFLHNFFGEFYFIFGQWEAALESSKMAMKNCKDFSIWEYMASRTRIVTIEYLKDNIYDKIEIEKIRADFRKENISINRREALLRLAFIPFLEKDYEYLLDILEEDEKLAEIYPIPKLDYIRGILLYSVSDDEDSIENLIKLETNMKKYNLPQIDLILNILLGKKFSEKNRYYEGINYLLETLDKMYRLIKNIPNKDLQKGFIRKHNTDMIKKELNVMMYKALDIELDCICIDELDAQDRIEKYFDSAQMIDFIKDSDFIKITETSNYVDEDIKSIDSVETLMSKLTSNYKINLQLILKYLAKETFAQKGYILMYDEDNNRYIPLVSLNGNYDWIPNENLLSLANRYEDGVLISNSFGDNTVDFYREFLPKGTRSLICVPIGLQRPDMLYMGKDRRQNAYYSNQRNEGYIYLETEKVFNRFDKTRHKLVYSLVQIVYINIENYRLKILSTIDKLTGTSTRKHFEQEYKKIFNDAKMKGSNFAVLMMDIDDFKKVNDTYGHRKGDEVLNKIGKCLKDSIRNTDFVARYGGEEFIIILKDINEKNAKEIGEKIRKNIEKLQVSKIEEPITMSIGIAMFPKHSQFKEELIEKADQALYNAKEKGKNKTVVWNADLFNTLHRADRLAGIISGNTNQDQRNVIAILDIIDLTTSDMPKEDKIFEFLGRLIETVDAETCTLIELDKNKNIKGTYCRTRMKQEWAEKSFVNFDIVEKAINTKKGEFLIDWENVENIDLVLNTPNWQSIIVFPMEFRGEIQGIIYMTVPLKEKEFDYNCYNMVKVLGGIFSTIV